MRRFGLTRTFALVSLLSMVALGAALVWSSSTLLRQQAMAAGSHTAETYVRLALDHDEKLQAAVEQDTVMTDEDAIAALRTHLGQAPRADAGQGGSGNLINVRVWSRNGKLVFESAPVAVGSEGTVVGFPDGLRLDRALSGKTAPT